MALHLFRHSLSIKQHIFDKYLNHINGIEGFEHISKPILNDAIEKAQRFGLMNLQQRGVPILRLHPTWPLQSGAWVRELLPGTQQELLMSAYINYYEKFSQKISEGFRSHDSTSKEHVSKLLKIDYQNFLFAHKLSLQYSGHPYLIYKALWQHHCHHQEYATAQYFAVLTKRSLQADAEITESNELWLIYCKLFKDIGYCYFEKAEYESASIMYTEAEKLFKQKQLTTDYPQTWIEILKHQGSIETSLKNYPKATDYLTEALQTVKASKTELQHLDQADIYFRLGTIQKGQFKHKHSLQYYQLASKLYEANLARQLYLDSRFNMATVFSQLQEYDKALEVYHELLPAYEQLKKQKAIAQVLQNIASIYLKTQDLTNSVIFSKKALHEYIILGDELRAAKVKNNLGLIYFRQEEFLIAKELLQEALVVYQKFGNVDLLIHALMNLGKLAQTQKRFEESSSHLQGALRIAKDKVLPAEEMQIYFNLGVLYRKMKQGERSIWNYEQSASLARRLGNVSFLGLTQQYAGINYFKREMWKIARPYFEQSLQHLSAKDHYRLAVSCRYLCEIALFLEDTTEAEVYSLKAIKLLQNCRGPRKESMSNRLLQHAGAIYKQTRSSVYLEDICLVLGLDKEAIAPFLASLK